METIRRLGRKQLVATLSHEAFKALVLVTRDYADKKLPVKRNKDALTTLAIILECDVGIGLAGSAPHLTLAGVIAGVTGAECARTLKKTISI